MRLLKPSDENEDHVMFKEIFADLMNAITGRDLMATLECGEVMAALESREKQKAFCTFASDCIRNIFMIQQGLPQLADVSGEEQEFYGLMASRLGKGFCMKSITNIEKVVAMIDRNVSSKILFCDLVDRMFLSI